VQLYATSDPIAKLHLSTLLPEEYTHIRKLNYPE